MQMRNAELSDRLKVLAHHPGKTSKIADMQKSHALVSGSLNMPLGESGVAR
jgi:hypothetical protein